MPNFIVALNSPAPAVRLPPGASVGVDHVPTRYGLASVTWYTRHSEEGFSAPVPRELWVEVRGQAPDLDTAMAELVDLGRVMTPLLALSANAPVEDPELEVAFDATPGVHSREFFQSMRPTDFGEPRSSRLLMGESVGPLVNSVFGSTEGDRLHRASVQYGEALKAWRPGRQLRCAMHLWMAVEALTKAAQRIEERRLGVDQSGLLRAWGIAVDDLDPTVRKRLIFHGSESTYSDLRKLSDALEHSFESLAPLHARAESVRDAAAKHVRQAILELADLPPGLLTTLTSPPFDSPKESFGMQRHLRGRLVGDSEQLAADGQPYPFVHVGSSMSAFDLNEDGSYRVTPTDTARPALGPGIQLTDVTYELWGPAQDSMRFLHRDSGADDNRH
jgi:hypothetical protein